MNLNWMVRYWSKFISWITSLICLKTLMILMKINFDDFLQHLKLELERYPSQNGKAFVVSLDELWTFIGINFVMRYHKLPTFRSYWEKGHPSDSVNYVANVLTRERFKEILCNLYFSNNEEALPREYPDHDRVLKVR